MNTIEVLRGLRKDYPAIIFEALRNGDIAAHRPGSRGTAVLIPVEYQRDEKWANIRRMLATLDAVSPPKTLEECKQWISSHCSFIEFPLQAEKPWQVELPIEDEDGLKMLCFIDTNPSRNFDGVNNFYKQAAPALHAGLVKVQEHTQTKRSGS